MGKETRIAVERFFGRGQLQMLSCRKEPRKSTALLRCSFPSFSVETAELGDPDTTGAELFSVYFLPCLLHSCSRPDGKSSPAELRDKLLMHIAPKAS